MISGFRHLGLRELGIWGLAFRDVGIMAPIMENQMEKKRTLGF